MQNPYLQLIRDLELTYKPILGTASTKTIKGEKLGYLTAIVYLTPDLQLCPYSVISGCLEGCLYTAGRGAFNKTQLQRQLKTAFFKENLRGFMLSLCADIWSLERKALKLGLIPLVRLNGTSDILWENITIEESGLTIFQTFPYIDFYDYTKHPKRKLEGKTANNYDLTYSYSGLTPKKITTAGFNNPDNKRVSVVFMRKEDIPTAFNNFKVIDGDDTDLRHIEPSNVIVSLYAKGKAKKDDSGFVQIKGVHYA